MDLQNFQKEIWIYRNKLLRFANQLLHQASDAEDIVQEVFLRMWKMGEKLNEYNSKEALAMQITKNLCADKRKLKQSQNYALEDNAYRTLSDAPSPHKTTELKDTKSWIDFAITQLPENQQVIIKLRDIEEYEFEEIAEILKMDINAIRVNLSRARKKIRDFLTEKENYEQK
ncbi:MAG: sigma-70 family RNA polymerase sigma factor [Cytophagia bacterium]|nr:MAG: sigma-70 family RNA polymerase sigma factor [Cytophagales bacterium]TAG06773.1 MAG: sigma-70 family RNA polymerase sigma factor [Cytophagia bacterium]TAG44325.1 MAG: sigma-70 family RNA polymerase sigma factor [Cytophagia bacterium]TAH29385.1 MAG: sigma-70 family RNA polymerase sigma factor [Cytophagales bacterium]